MFAYRWWFVVCGVLRAACCIMLLRIACCLLFACRLLLFCRVFAARRLLLDGRCLSVVGGWRLAACFCLLFVARVPFLLLYVVCCLLCVCCLLSSNVGCVLCDV